MHEWVTANARQIIAGLLALIFASELYILATRNTLGAWWRVWVTPPESGFPRTERMGLAFANAVCLVLCLLAVVV